MNYYICHHGIKGQKWGVRRFQNEDGTLTPAGKRRYGAGIDRLAREVDEVSKKYVNDSSAGYKLAAARVGVDAPRGIKRFNRDSKEYKDLVSAASEYTKSNAKFNKEVYKQLRKDGYNTRKLHAKYMQKDFANWEKLYNKGREYANRIFDDNPEYANKYNAYKDASSRYQTKVEKFIDSLGYESLDRTLSGRFNTSVDLRTGKVYKTKVKNAISVAMLINAGGMLNTGSTSSNGDERKPIK